jgi:hypothetical protein
MKLPTLLLVGSLTANAALVFVLFRRGDPTPLPAPTTVPPALSSALSASGSALPPGVTPRAWATLDTPDHRQLITRLRACGFAPHVIRALVEARIETEFARRFRELEARLPARAFWQPDPQPYFADEPRRLEAYRPLINERKRLLQTLLAGIDPEADAREVKTLQQRYGELPAEKLARVKALHDDYAEISYQTRDEFRGVMLPEDRAQLELLRREQRADLAQLLTPAELAEYDRRDSPFSYAQKTILTAMDATEAEFLVISGVYQKFAGEVLPGPGGNSAENVLRRDDVQAEIAAQLKTAIGDARYADYVRASHPEYQRILYFLGDPPAAGAASQTFGALNAAALDSARIVGDLTLSADQQRAALTQLASAAEIQITAALGPAAASRYRWFANGWLQDLRNGRAFAVTPTGLQLLPRGPRKP